MSDKEYECISEELDMQNLNDEDLEYLECLDEDEQLENTEREELSDEDLEEKLLDLLVIPLDVDNLDNLSLNKDNFKKGINKVSEIAGMFVTLKNVGMNSDMAYDMVKSITNINAQLSIQDKVCNMELKCSKEETNRKANL